jgi:hypothetical protein
LGYRLLLFLVFFGPLLRNWLFSLSRLSGFSGLFGGVLGVFFGL